MTGIQRCGRDVLVVLLETLCKHCNYDAMGNGLSECEYTRSLPKINRQPLHDANQRSSDARLQV